MLGLKHVDELIVVDLLELGGVAVVHDREVLLVVVLQHTPCHEYEPTYRHTVCISVCVNV